MKFHPLAVTAVVWGGGVTYPPRGGSAFCEALVTTTKTTQSSATALASTTWQGYHPDRKDDSLGYGGSQWGDYDYDPNSNSSNHNRRMGPPPLPTTTTTTTTTLQQQLYELEQQTHSWKQLFQEQLQQQQQALRGSSKSSGVRVVVD